MTSNLEHGEQKPTEPEPRLNIVVSAQGESGPSWWSHVKVIGEIGIKLLTLLAIVIFVIAFRVEISDFLSKASKVEAFGFKLEKSEFDKRLQLASEKGPGDQLTIDKNNPAWTDAPFRKLKLAGPTLKNLKVLWVDDHPENNFYLRRILSDLGIQITIAVNNAEALDAAKRHDFDIVISDFNRDEPLRENGGELALELNKLGYEVSFVFYTSDPNKVPEQVRRVAVDATNDPASLLSTVAELAIQKA
jgi:CheY-like chemotaxis protein